MNKMTMGHIAALITIVIWGTTFISTKILLTDFTPIEILFFRFLLYIIAPKITSYGDIFLAFVRLIGRHFRHQDYSLFI